MNTIACGCGLTYRTDHLPASCPMCGYEVGTFLRRHGESPEEFGERCLDMWKQLQEIEALDTTSERAA